MGRGGEIITHLGGQGLQMPLSGTIPAIYTYIVCDNATFIYWYGGSQPGVRAHWGGYIQGGLNVT